MRIGIPEFHMKCYPFTNFSFIKKSPRKRTQNYFSVLKNWRIQHIFEHLSERLRTSKGLSSTNYVLMKPYLQYKRNKTHLGKVLKCLNHKGDIQLEFFNTVFFILGKGVICWNQSVQQKSMIMLNPSEGTWQVSKVNPPGFQLCQDVCLLDCYTTCFSRFSGLSDSTINCQQLATPWITLSENKTKPSARGNSYHCFGYFGLCDG